MTLDDIKALYETSFQALVDAASELFRHSDIPFDGTVLSRHYTDPDKFIAHEDEFAGTSNSYIERWSAPSERPLRNAFANHYKQLKLYVIARDEGIGAAMLWKLANA